MRRTLIILALVLAGCAGDRSFTPTMPEALEQGTAVEVFVATNRAITERGVHGSDRETRLDLLDLTVSIPPDHTPGTLDFGYENPKPERQFTMAARKQLESDQAFISALTHRLAERSAPEREVIVFVHGYNSTQAETVFRVAQIKHDLDTPGEMVVFSWPSKARPLSYAYDLDSAMLSRDALEKTIALVGQARPKRIILVAHSMGSALVMETLRQMEITRPGWPAQVLGGVILMSPDIDVDLFRFLMGRFSEPPQPFIIVASERDKALRLSSQLRGQKPENRLGSIGDLSRISDLPVVLFDTTSFTSEAESSHLVAVTSPGMITFLRQARELEKVFGPEPALITQILGGELSQENEARRIELQQREVTR